MSLKIQDCLEYTLSKSKKELRELLICIDDSCESLSLVEKRKKNSILLKTSPREIIDFASGAAISQRTVINILKSRNDLNKLIENVLELAQSLNNLTLNYINIFINQSFHDLNIEKFSKEYSKIQYKIFIPSNPYDFCSLLKKSFNFNFPVFFLLSSDIFEVEGPVPDFENDILTQDGAELRKESNNMTLIATGEDIFQACDLLNNQNFDAEIIETRSLFPIDYSTLVKSISKTKKGKIIQTDNYLSTFNYYLCNALKKYCKDASIEIEKLSA